MGLLIFVCVIYTELLQNCMMYQTAHGPCLSQALTTTTPIVENSEQETGEAIENIIISSFLITELLILYSMK
jgi:hypothetical protein